jgi:hypothetical protein
LIGQRRLTLIAGTAPSSLAAEEADGSPGTAAPLRSAREPAERRCARLGNRPPLPVRAGRAGAWLKARFDRARPRIDNSAGGFHPDTVVIAGGGTKGTVLPADYQEQVAAFFSPANVVTSYGMSEVTTSWPRCTAGRYHCPPTTIPLVLDESGERLLGPRRERTVGRLGFFDLLVDGRWGGLVTGDEVEAYASPCPCGRGDGVTLSRIGRLSAGADDQLTCAGTIEGYLRGFLSVEAS